MDFKSFRSIVNSFIDSPEQMVSENGDFAIQIGSDVFSGSLNTRNGNIYVTEGEKKSSAEDWIINRLAMLPALADRIILSSKPQQAFVTPKAQYLPAINDSRGDELANTDNALDTIEGFLDAKPGGTCSVLYLTSDAGEGKTTTIGELARRQAEKFKRRETDWLLVPINLGGKPFLRFDDVVVAALMNQLRFQRLYFDSFMYLVRMGVIVPALDGFEEIFVENVEGDAISSLGSLIHQLQDEGCLLIAARKAYFEFQSLSNQAKLLDGLRNSDVSFARVSLNRWGRDEFIKYAVDMALTPEEANRLYEGVTAILGEDHPLVTRPVLVRRLIEVFESRGDAVLADIRPRASGYFSWLIQGILTREANEKWLDKHGSPPKPLLSMEQHHELLGYVAEEMWTSKTSVLNGDMLESLAEIYCDAAGLSPITARQVRERIKQHALIVSAGIGSRDFRFDHENFREYFLGEQLYRHIVSANEDDIRRIFRAELLPQMVQEAAIERIQGKQKQVSSLIDLILKVTLSEASSSFVRENGGLLLSGLLTCDRAGGVKVNKIVFPPESLHGRVFKGISFVDCYFRPTSISNSRFEDCQFLSCEFEELSTDAILPVVLNSSLAGSRIHCYRTEEDEGEHYDPDEALSFLTDLGFTTPLQEPLDIKPASNLEDDLRIVRKVIHAFYRSTTIFENIFQRRLSLDASRFFNHILPLLKRARIIEEITATSSTKYRLGVTYSVLSKALSDCDGQFQRFLDKVEELR